MELREFSDNLHWLTDEFCDYSNFIEINEGNLRKKMEILKKYFLNTSFSRNPYNFIVEDEIDEMNEMIIRRTQSFLLSIKHHSYFDWDNNYLKEKILELINYLSKLPNEIFQIALYIENSDEPAIYFLTVLYNAYKDVVQKKGE